MTKETKQDVLRGLRNVGLAAVALGAIVATDLFLPRALLFVVGPVVCGGLAGLVSKGPDREAAMATWAVVGLITGVGAYFAL